MIKIVCLRWDDILVTTFTVGRLSFWLRTVGIIRKLYQTENLYVRTKSAENNGSCILNYGCKMDIMRYMNKG